MAIGERIRFIRNLRGMTQKWLGIAVGFPEKSADIRMAQYEGSTRTPKENVVKSLANILDVSPLALSVPDIDSDFGLMHTFFAIEDIHGIKASLENGEVTLHFTNTKTLNPELLQMVYQWAEQSEKYNAGEISKEEYDKWRYHYPDFANLKGYVKVTPSQELSDMLVDDFHKSRNNGKRNNR